MKIPSLLLALGVVPAVLSAQQPQDRPPQARMASIQALHLPKLANSALPTYYSVGEQARAEKLEAFVAGERAFYRKQLGVPLDDLVLAVLSPTDWDRVSAPMPYGMPSVEGHPRVIAMPASWARVTAMPLPTESEASPALRAKARETGMAWNAVMQRGADGIGAHELGHAIVEDYGIGWTTYWFNEFLASYLGDVYLVQERQQDVPANLLFWKACLAWPHAHTSLDYFEAHYEDLGNTDPRNYGWYEVALDQRVIAVYDQEGIGFLAKVKAAFPKGGPKLTSAQVLDRLEAMDPGWKAWAAKLEADKVEALR